MVLQCQFRRRAEAVNDGFAAGQSALRLLSLVEKSAFCMPGAGDLHVIGGIGGRAIAGEQIFKAIQGFIGASQHRQFGALVVHHFRNRIVEAIAFVAAKPFDDYIKAGKLLLRALQLVVNGCNVQRSPQHQIIEVRVGRLINLPDDLFVTGHRLFPLLLSEEARAGIDEPQGSFVQVAPGYGHLAELMRRCFVISARIGLEGLQKMLATGGGRRVLRACLFDPAHFAWCEFTPRPDRSQFVQSLFKVPRLEKFDAHNNLPLKAIDYAVLKLRKVILEQEMRQIYTPRMTDRKPAAGLFAICRRERRIERRKWLRTLIAGVDGLLDYVSDAFIIRSFRRGRRLRGRQVLPTGSLGAGGCRVRFGRGLSASIARGR